MKSYNEFILDLKHQLKTDCYYYSSLFFKTTQNRYYIYYSFVDGAGDWSNIEQSSVWLVMNNKLIAKRVYPKDSGNHEDCEKRVLMFIKDIENELKEIYYSDQLKQILEEKI